MKNIVFILSLLTAFVFGFNAYAEQSYTVRKGDNLYVIAKKFNVTVAMLIDTNNIKSKKLRIGAKLTLPDSHNSDRQQKTAIKHKDTKTVSKKALTQTNEKPNNYHFVRKGDTLRSVAEKYSMTVGELKKLNHLKSQKIKIGRKLIVRRSNPSRYIVKNGDTLWRIASKFNKIPGDLKRINSLGSNSIKPGQVILLSAPLKVDEPSDSMVLSSVKEDVYSPPTINEKPAVIINEVREMSQAEDLSDLSVRERLILFAKKMLHLPYRFGGNGTLGLDCSSYVQKVYEIAGITLPRSARQQYKVGESVEKGQLSTGDLVFFRTYASYPSHVGIYLGNNLFIHASSKSKKITIDSLDTPYYLRRFIGAKKIIVSEDGDNLNQLPDKDS